MVGLVLADTVELDATQLATRLKVEGIDTRPFFLGMHEQPVFQERGLFLRDRFPVAERLACRGLYLPSGIGLTNDQVDQICASVGEVLG